MRVPEERLAYFDAGVNGTGPAPLWVAQQNVLGFQVSVEDPFASEDLHGLSNLLQEYADGVLAQRALTCETAGKIRWGTCQRRTRVSNRSGEIYNFHMTHSYCHEKVTVTWSK